MKNKYVMFWTIALIMISCAYADMMTQKTQYYAGEEVIIRLTNFSEKDQLIISSDKETYRLIGLTDTISFIPKYAGNHLITLISQNNESLASKTITVINLNQEDQKISTNKQIYSTSELVIIYIGTNYSALRIISETESYYYLGDKKENLSFVPSGEGNYSISIYDGQNQEIDKTGFIVKNEQYESQVTIYDYAALNTLTTNIYTVFPKKKQVNFRPEVVDSSGQNIDVQIRTINETFQSFSMRNISIENIQQGLELIPPNNHVKKIRFNRINLDKGLNIGLEDVAVERADIEFGVVNSVFAIDPTRLDFDYATVSFTATNYELFKCANWNFSKQKCFGSWTKIMDTTPGKEYNITLTPFDPAYAQITRIADNCNKTTAVCTAAELTSINASGGTNFSLNRGMNTLRVSFQNGTTDMDQIVNCTVIISAYENEGNNWYVAFGNYLTNNYSLGGGAIRITAYNNYTWDCTPYFASFSNDSLAFNNFGIRLNTTDSPPTATGLVDFIRVFINYTIYDIIIPTYANISAYPVSPVTYLPNQFYQFNTTWDDNEGINNSWIDHNFNGTYTNYSMTGNFSSKYYYNLTTGLIAGTYQWRTCANDSKNNINCTPYQTYTVNKAVSVLNLTLNGQNSNITIERESTATINGTITAPTGGYIELYQNGSIINTGYGSLQNVTTYYNQSDYNITLKYFTTQNYTEGIVSYILRVKDTTPPNNITNLNEQANGSSFIYWTWTNPSNNDFDHVEVYLNQTFKTNVTTNYYNATGLFADEPYEIEVRPVDRYGNAGNWTNDTARTKTSSDTDPPIIYNILNHSITDGSVIINWSTDEPSTTYVFYGITSGVYTNISYDNDLVIYHTRSLTGLYPDTVYYYVVNSTDSAGNSNKSIEYSFRTLADTTPPYYSNIIAHPASPTVYSKNQIYQFNTSWNDVVSINTAWIDNNFLGFYKNDTTTGNISNSYYYNLTTGLAAGTYEWRMCANDSENNINCTPYQAYIVDKATSQVQLLLNGTSASFVINESQSVNITGRLLIGQGNISLYENGELINQGTSPLTNITTYYTPGVYWINLTYDETQNYTPNYQNLSITVNDVIAPFVNLTNPQNGYIDYDGQLTLYFHVNDTGTLDSCKLFINGTLNDTKEIYTKGQNTFSFSAGNGNYSWNINCNDTTNNVGYSQIHNFTISINEFYAKVFPVNCSDAQGSCNVTSINFSDTSYEAHGSLPRPGVGYVYINFTNQTNIPLGSTIHYLNISYNKYQATTTGNFFLEWFNTSSSVWLPICQKNFSVSSTPPTYDPVNCNFTESGNGVPTVTQINNGIRLRAGFNHTANPNNILYGSEFVSIGLKYTTDATPPNVELISPQDASYGTVGDNAFEYRPSDPNLFNCTIYGDFNGTYGPNATQINPVSDSINQIIVNLKAGFYTWNVRCIDIANNYAFATQNWTINVTNPDLEITHNDILFSNNNPLENENITIFATIKNIGDVNTSKSFNVSFFNGDPSISGMQIGDNVSVTNLGFGKNITINTTWIVPGPGPYKIFVLVDVPLNTNGTIIEISEDNNYANRSINVSGWHVVFGKFNGTLILSTFTNKTIDSWDYSNTNANIYVTETGLNINWYQLQSLGRTTTESPALNDFKELDTQLLMTNFSDSVTNKYSSDGGTTPRDTKSLIIYGNIVLNAPITNSTVNNNFVTGILWDKSDGGLEYDGTQDVVFVTTTNPNSIGKYGTYDYEITLPTKLRDYKEGVYNTIAYYYEIR